MRYLLTLALAIAATPALAADQFDLVCKGQERSDGAVKPAEVHYRIDLAARRWCKDDCAGVRPVVDITTDQITLAKIDKGQPPMFARETQAVNRLTGVASMSLFTAYGSTSFTGQCEPAPFSGLPAPKF